MELWGNLKDFSLPDVIQLVGFGRKTGVLSVEHGGAGSRLYFSGGNVIHAVSEEIEGEEAVYALFRVEEGQFRFQADTAPPRQTIFMDPTNLVMEAARLLDEASRSDGVEEQKPKPPPEPKVESAPKAPVAGELPGGDAMDRIDAFGLAPVEAKAGSISPKEARRLITELLEKKFGKESKRLTQAVAKCGDTTEDFQELAVRVERFVSAFVDPRSATKVGNELREIIRRI